MRYITVLAVAILATGCGGGGSTSTTPIAQSSDDIGCSQEYYQTMIGTYTGIAELNETGPFPRSCSWNTEFTISGTSILTQCLLRASTNGDVSQMTFFPDDDLNRYQCLEDSGERSLSEPIGPSFPISVFPMLDNTQYPVQVTVSKNNLIDSGPFFGDTSLIASYVNLFDGSQSELADTIIVEGDGTLSLRSGSGILLGTLVKEL